MAFDPPDTLRAHAAPAGTPCTPHAEGFAMKHATPTDPGYHLPTEAHAELQALRDHLHLLAQLSTPEHQNADDLILTRAGLAHCFTHLADTADRIVAAVTA